MMKSTLSIICFIFILITFFNCNQDNRKKPEKQVQKQLAPQLKLELEYRFDDLETMVKSNEKFSHKFLNIMFKNDNFFIDNSNYVSIFQQRGENKIQELLTQLKDKLGRYNNKMSDSEFTLLEERINRIENSFDFLKSTNNNIRTLSSSRSKIYNMYSSDKKLKIINNNLKLIKTFNDSLNNK